MKTTPEFKAFVKEERKDPSASDYLPSHREYHPEWTYWEMGSYQGLSYLAKNPSDAMAQAMIEIEWPENMPPLEQMKAMFRAAIERVLVVEPEEGE